MPPNRSFDIYITSGDKLVPKACECVFMCVWERESQIKRVSKLISRWRNLNTDKNSETQTLEHK